ncbi:MAG: hypothetical protein ACXAEU_20930 [Candidatus Hodarchaeales archaeon]|jgi:hypothetical protein
MDSHLPVPAEKTYISQQNASDSMQVEKLSREHGLKLIRDDPDYLHCCMRCDVAEVLGSVEICPQRVFTCNSCCPSCSIFLEHGLEAMLSHWGDKAQYFGAIQIAIPLAVSEDIIRSAFLLHKVPVDELRLQYQWKGWSFDCAFEKSVNWVALIKHMYFPINFEKEFLRDPLIYGLTGFSERAGASLFVQLREVLQDFMNWISKNFPVDPEEIFVNANDGGKNISYYAGYFIRINEQSNMAIDILAPDYERSSEPEQCLMRIGIEQIPVISFSKINKTLLMQQGIVSAWESIKPSLERMLEELGIITTDMHISLNQLSDLLDRVQTIQGQFLKMKPVITNMRGSISTIVPLLSEPLISELFPNFNLDLVNNWLDFSRSVERSVEGASSFIQSKLNLMSLQQEKKVTKRLNILTALFGSLSGFNLILAFISWLDPQPTLTEWLIIGSLILSLTALSLIFVYKLIPED